MGSLENSQPDSDFMKGSFSVKKYQWKSSETVWPGVPAAQETKAGEEPTHWYKLVLIVRLAQAKSLKTVTAIPEKGSSYLTLKQPF